MKPTTLFAAVAVVAASAAIPMVVNAATDGTVELNGFNWNYYDKDDVNKTVTLGAKGSTSRDHCLTRQTNW